MKTLIELVLAPFIFTFSIVTIIITVIVTMFTNLFKIFKVEPVKREVPEITLGSYRSFGTYDGFYSCKFCEEQEYFSFESEDMFNVFFHRLKNNLHISFVCHIDGYSIPSRIGLLGVYLTGQSSQGASIYKCKECGQYFELSEPDNAWRGYFRRIIKKECMPGN